MKNFRNCQRKWKKSSASGDIESKNLSPGPGPVIGLDEPLEEAAGAEGGFEEEAAYPAFGKVMEREFDVRKVFKKL